LQQAAAHGADDELTAYLRAAVGSAPMPPRPPRAYVQQLFDAYADDFDDHLTAGLGYEAPARLVALLQAHGALKADTQALDLGCGTGAFAPLLQGKIAALDGIDLSPRMCEAAARRGGYRQLGCADLAEHLAATQRRYGLVLAADVFIYVGVLDAVFAGLQRVLLPGGVLACSIEWLPDDAASPQLRSSARYAHSIADLCGLGERCGLHLRCAERGVLRTEQGLPIDGAYVLMAAG
jgi:predicted TPR repeat methyltransferase